MWARPLDCRLGCRVTKPGRAEDRRSGLSPQILSVRRAGQAAIRSGGRTSSGSKTSSVKTLRSSGFWLMRNWRKSRSRRSRMETSRPGTPAASRSSPAARLGVSEQFACRVTGQHRATQRHEPVTATPRDPDATLRSWLRHYAMDHPRRGFRPAYHNARAEGWAVNHEKIQCLWREEGLRVPQRRRHKGHGNSTAHRP